LNIPSLYQSGFRRPAEKYRPAVLPLWQKQKRFFSWQCFIFVVLHPWLVPGLALSGRQRGSWGIAENEVQQGEMGEKVRGEQCGEHTAVQACCYTSPAVWLSLFACTT